MSPSNRAWKLTGIAALFYFLPNVTATGAAVLCLWLALSAGREAIRRRGD